MSVYLKPGMQSHHMLGNSPSNLLGNVSTSLAQPGVMEPTTQPLTADPIAQPADAYVVKHQPVKRHLGQRGGLVGGVLLTAGLLLGAASLNEPTVDIDHMPEGITRFLDGEVPGLGNTEMTSAQLFAELDGEMVPMEVVSGMHSDLLSGGTLASASTNFATLLAAAKPKGKWGKFKNWAGKTKVVKWGKKKLKKPAGWVKKNPFGSMGIMAGLFLLNLLITRKWLKARSKKIGLKIYQEDIPEGHYFDTGTMFVARCDGQIITSSQAQRDVLAQFTSSPQRKLVEVLKKLYPRDNAGFDGAKNNTEQEIAGKRGWLMEMPTQAGEDKGYTLTLTPYKVGRVKRRWRYWRCTKQDNKIRWAKWVVEQDRKNETLPWANRRLGWMPIVGMSLKQAKKIVEKEATKEKSNETIPVSNPQIISAKTNGNGSKTRQPLHACYTTDGDTVIIYRNANDPLIFPGWQGLVIQNCANKDPGQTLTLIMTYLGEYEEATEQTVRNFLGRLVEANLMVNNNEFYQLHFEKGTAKDAKRLGNGVEPVAFYEAPPPKPKPQKPEYKTTRDGSTMFIVMPNGDVERVDGWQLMALGGARASSQDKAKTIDQIFEGIGMKKDDYPEFSLFIHTAIANKWLLDLGDSKVMFILEEGDFIPPKSPAPRHPKSVPAINDGTGTGDFTGVMDRAAAERDAVKRPPQNDPAAGPSSPPEAAPPVGARAPKRVPTPTEIAQTMMGQGVKDASAAAIPVAAPEPSVVKARPGVPELKLPIEPAAPAAASVPAPPEQQPTKSVEKAEDLIKGLHLPEPAEPPAAEDDDETSTVMPRPPTGTQPVSAGTMRALGLDGGPAMAATFDEPGGAQSVPKESFKDIERRITGQFRRPDVPPTPPAAAFPSDKRPTVIHDAETPEAVAGPAQPPPLPMDAELTTEFSRARVKAALAKADAAALAEAAEGDKPPSLPPEASLPLEDRKVSEGDAKKPGPPPRGRKAKVRRPGESRMTIQQAPEGTDENPIKLATGEIIVTDEGNGSDEG